MKKGLLALFLVLVLCGCAPKSQEMPEMPALKTHFDAFDVEGAFVLYDQQDDAYTFYDRARCGQQFTPASTFKILNALIALESGVIADEEEVIPWDGIDRGYDSWNRDHTLRTGMQYSVVWFYQELARRIGTERMQHYVDAVGYGNQDISGALDSFWLDGGLRISPEEQVDFLRRLYAGDLPFSERSLSTVKDIMTLEQTDEFTLRGKVGWAARIELQIGWFVGYLEKDGRVYFFATNIESAQPDGQFGQARTEITKRILRDMALLPD